MDLYSYDQNLSTVNKVQREYWMAKQVLKKRLGKPEDEHVVAGDNDIDCKLAQYKSIQDTCVRLLKELETYHSTLCMLARDENNLGRFLKDQGTQDSTKAGKMMIAVGKALCYSAQQRLHLRHPMGRLREDIDTFRIRAISDTSASVEKMEIERNHYRASLLWMQNISENLDPEQYSRLEKFKKVQNEVRINKEKFDRRKWAVCQKVDLLSASRSNLFSNTLAPYQNELVNFWDKTAQNMAAVLESFRGYQHYEFKLLKDLNPIQLPDDGEPAADIKEIKDEGDENDDALINLDNQDEFGENPFADAMEDLDLHDNTATDEDNTNKASNILGEDFQSAPQTTKEIDLWNDLMDDQGTPTDFENQWKSSFGDFVSASPLEQAANAQTEKDVLDVLKPADRKLQTAPAPQHDNSRGFMPSQLLDMHFMQSLGQAPMHQIPMPPAYHTLNQAQPIQTGMQSQPHQFSLSAMPGMNMPAGPFQPNMGQVHQTQAGLRNQRASGADSKKGKADWYNLFAELDPLQNPDALGKKAETEEDGRAC